jgi:rubredoxin
MGEQIPKGWRQLSDSFLCPRCADADEDAAIGDVLEEEVIYPTDDTIDEDECSVCGGPCQGH